MKIALFGASGLIGGAIREGLLKEFEIFCPDRAFYDFGKPETLSALDISGCKALIHAAGVTDELVKKDLQLAYQHALWGSRELVQLAAKNKISKIIYFSTAHVYGSTEGLIEEFTLPCPQNDYALCHLMAENIMRQHAIKNEIDLYVFRPTAVYGMPHDLKNFKRWSLIPYSFPLNLVNSGKIVLQSSGDQLRSFIGLETLLAYTKKVLEQELDKGFCVINPIGEETMSVYEFAELSADIFKQVTGNNGIISRPKSIQSVSQDKEQYAACDLAGRVPLQYKSLFLKPQVCGNLREYLERFFIRLIQEKNNGVVYGL